jgi:hypothetical protein
MVKQKEYEGEIPPGLASRLAVSIVVGLGWLAFLVVLLWFYAADLGILKTLAVLILSILVVCAILIPVWIHWGLKTAYVWERKRRRARK